MEDIYHECGIFGVADESKTIDIVPFARLATENLQHRGPLGAGLMVCNGLGNMPPLKGPGLVREVLSAENVYQAGLRGFAALGHTRYATNALLDPGAYQPHRFTQFGLVYNGNIPNWYEQMIELFGKDVQPQFEGDTGFLGHCVVSGMQSDVQNSLVHALTSLDRVVGSFNLGFMEPDGSMHAVRDRHGRHPLVWGRSGSLFMFASEDAAIREALQEIYGRNPDELHDVAPGSAVSFIMGEEQVRIAQALQDGPNRQHVAIKQLWRPEPRYCFTEDQYFSYWQTHHDGISVTNARSLGGLIHAERDAERPDTDICLAVPDSSLLAGYEYARKRDIPFVGLIRRNREVGRTFLAHTPEERKEKAEKKYYIDRGLVKNIKGRGVMVIDDSLIRSTTMSVLLAKIVHAAVAENVPWDKIDIHVRFATPPYLWPCYDGINFPTLDELFVRRYWDGTFTPEGTLTDAVLQKITLALSEMTQASLYDKYHKQGIEMSAEIESGIANFSVGSVQFLPIPGLARSLGKPPNQICTSCVTGEYYSSVQAGLASEAHQTFCQKRAASLGK